MGLLGLAGACGGGSARLADSGVADDGGAADRRASDGDVALTPPAGADAAAAPVEAAADAVAARDAAAGSPEGAFALDATDGDGAADDAVDPGEDASARDAVEDGAPDAEPTDAPDDAASIPSPDAPVGAAPLPSPILPVVLLEVRGVPIGETDKTAGVIKIITDHDGTLAGIAQRDPSFASPMAIELRGATTTPKRSYSFELRDSLGKDRSLPVLGLPSESDFVLYACYADKTCLRNVLAYQLGRDLGRWAPRTRFVELLLDGQYQGLYVLVERIKQHKHRVDVAKPAESAFTGDLTGGYIFKMEGPGEGKPGDQPLRDWVSAPGQRVYSYHFPKFDKIVNVPVQRAYLQGYVAAFETMMKAADWATKYPATLDVAAWVDHTLILEAANNVHGYASSAYLHKQGAARGGKLFAGPLWDFDGAFGNATVRDGMRTETWAHAGNRFGTFATPYAPPGALGHVPFYWEKLWSDPAFRVLARCRWQQVRATLLADAALDARLAAWRAELRLAQPRDQAKWKTIGMKLPSNDFVGATWDAEVTHLRDWLGKRLAWMDAELGRIPGACPAADAGAGDAPPATDAGAGDAPDAPPAADAASPDAAEVGVPAAQDAGAQAPEVAPDAGSAPDAPSDAKPGDAAGPGG